MGKLTVGQKLWYVPSRAREQAREVTVEAVGRKWATMDRCNRIDMETLEADGAGYSSPGQCYSSREAWCAEVARQKAWRVFRDNIDYAPPAEIPTDAIYQAAALLGIELPARGGE